LFNPVYIQISKFFTGLTDKTDCLTPSHMRALGNHTWSRNVEELLQWYVIHFTV